MTSLDKNVLVDGNNLIHRSYAVFVKDKLPGELMLSPSGYGTGLIYGVLSMLSDWLMEMSSPTSASFFLDGSSAWRLAIDPEYKRKDGQVRPWYSDSPITLSNGYVARNEIDVITHLMFLFGIDVYRNPEHEADDLIASFVRSKPNDVHIIVSSDIDFYQLLSFGDRVVIFRPGSGRNRFFDAEGAEAHMLKKYKVRVPPENVRMFKALTGDHSDGIRGVPRLRKRVAAPLCHLDVDGLYATGFPGFSKAEREKIESLKDLVRNNYELVGLRNCLDLSAFRKTASSDYPAASRILKEDLGITTIFPHAFRFGRNGVRLSGPTSFDMLPDFLKEIVAGN